MRAQAQKDEERGARQTEEGMVAEEKSCCQGKRVMGDFEEVIEYVHARIQKTHSRVWHVQELSLYKGGYWAMTVFVCLWATYKGGLLVTPAVEERV